MNTTDKRLVVEMLAALAHDPTCFWCETEGLAIALGADHPLATVYAIDTTNGTELNLNSTPEQLIWSLTR